MNGKSFNLCKKNSTSGKKFQPVEKNVYLRKGGDLGEDIILFQQS
jgi:hypothetical protein